MELQGRLYLPNSSENRMARLLLNEQGGLELVDEEFTFKAHLSQLKVSAAMGDQPRRFEFPTGEQIVVEASAELTQWLKDAGHSQFINQLERNWLMIITAALLTSLFVAWLYLYGLPLSSRWVANHLPPAIAQEVGEYTLEQLTEVGFEPSQLPDETQQQLHAQFDALVARLPELPQPVRLELRQVEKIKNAFALADGTIVLTDDLVRLADQPTQLQGVMLHELAHVAHNDVMATLVRSTFFTILVNLMVGDVSGSVDLIVAASSFGVAMSYSRQAEQKADLYACQHLREDPRAAKAMVTFMEKLFEEDKRAHLSAWLSSHPEGDERVSKLESCLVQ